MNGADLAVLVVPFLDGSSNRVEAGTDLEVPKWYSAESTEAMRIKFLAQGNNILLPGFEPSTSVFQNRHSSQPTNMLLLVHRQCFGVNGVNVVTECRDG